MEDKKSRVGLWLGAFIILAFTVFIIIVIVRVTGSIPVPDDVGKILETDHVLGNAEAAVTLIEYSDYECPACAIYKDDVNKIVAEFENHIAFAYRHYPLEMHVNSKAAVRASEAAGLQGKFWEMHDLLFENQAVWGEKADPELTFTGYAATLGLDTVQFASDYNSRRLKQFASDAEESAADIGLTYTPTFILNGEIIKNPRGYENFRTIIREAIEATESTNKN